MLKTSSSKQRYAFLAISIFIISVCLTACMETTAGMKTAAPEVTYQKPVVAVSSDKTIYTDQELWNSSLKEKQLKQSAFAFVKADPSLPNILLMGGPISVGYTPTVREELAGIANVYRVPAGGGDTKSALKNLEKWLAGSHWNVIHFNWGMNDLKRRKQTDSGETPPNRVMVEQYASNLDQIVSKLEKSAESLIWASTTIIPDGAKSRVVGDEVIFNQAALEVMKKHPAVKHDDLYALSKNHPEDQKPGSVSFKKEGQQRQGVQVANSIKIVLGE